MEILETRVGDVLTLTLNRPAVRNALTQEMKASLLAILERENAAPSARVLLLKGAGAAFCSGADVRPDEILARRATIGDEIRSGTNRIVTLLAALPYPVVAAVQGPAAGAGTGLALAADLLLVSPSARLHVSFSKIGAVPDAGTSSALVHKLGASRAASLALLGGTIDAEQAVEWGLATRLSSEETFEDEALDFVTKLAAGPTRALALTKKLLASAQSLSAEAQLDREAELQAEAFATADFEEGVRALAQKRVPKFTGG